MPLLLSQFKKACSTVEPDDDDVDNASTAHSDVRDCLAEDDTLTQWGLTSLLIGSYARQVSIRRIKDVDVFCMVPKVDTSLTSQEVLRKFIKVLGEKYDDDRIIPQDRSVQVKFDEFDMHVDVVPARPVNGRWEIPDRTERGAGWQQTDPLKLGTLTTTMNDNNESLYIPVVKLIRQTRRAALGKRPGGFYFEILTYHAFASGLSGKNIPTLYVQALEHIAGQLEVIAAGGSVADPAIPGENLKVRVSDAEHQTAATKFREVATAARRAYSDDNDCRAALAFQKLLGRRSDDKEWVFPMPDYCNADGTTKAAVQRGDSTVPGAGASPRFA